MTANKYVGLLLFLAFTLYNSQASSVSDLDSQYRLPKHVVPLHYKLELEPPVKYDTFKGVVTIDINVTRPTQKITLHSCVDVFSVDVDLKDTALVQDDFRPYRFQEEYEFLHIFSQTILDVGNHTIRIKFTGKISSTDEKLVGFYKTEYVNQNDELETLLVTFLQPTYARYVFPCFDEPALKATFETTLVIPDNEGYQAVSNGIEKRNYKCGNKLCVEFEPTLLISTYMNAFVVTKYTYNEQIYNSGDQQMRVRVYSNRAPYTRDAAVGAVVYGTFLLTNYTDMKLPLKKIDIVSIPSYLFEDYIQAVESWGLILANEANLHFDPQTETPWAKRAVYFTVLNGLVPFWFGNLVTLEWWDHLWLNKIGTYLVAKYALQIDNLKTEKIKVKSNILVADSMLKHVVTPKEIASKCIYPQMSRVCAYPVTVMVSDTIGENAFQTALQNYLKKYAFKTAVTENLIEELQAVSPSQNVTDLVRSFTSQGRFPMVTAKKEGKYVELKQQPFSLIPLDDPPSPEFGYKWTIPIRYITSENATTNLIWFNRKDESIRIYLGNAEWIILNPTDTGMYFSQHSKDLWKNLTANIMKMNVDHRAYLLSNGIFSYMRDDSYKATLIILLEYLKEETEYPPWNVMYKWAKKIISRDTTGELKELIVKSISTAYKTYEQISGSADLNTRYTYATIIKLACALNTDVCIDYKSNKSSQVQLDIPGHLEENPYGNQQTKRPGVSPGLCLLLQQVEDIGAEY